MASYLSFKAAIILFSVFLLLLPVSADDVGQPEYNVTLVVFGRTSCPHCQAEKEFMSELLVRYPQVTFDYYDLETNPEFVPLLLNFTDAYGEKPGGVPANFIGDTYFAGYGNTFVSGQRIENKVKFCIKYGCLSPYLKLTNSSMKLELVQPENVSNIMLVPGLGEVDPLTVSLPAFTMAVGLLDGFNPCAMWVLTFLLALLVYTRSRRKMFLVGGIFILASGISYFLFMAAWLNLFLFVGYATPTRVAIGAFAVAAGLINLKDVFWFKKGPSLTIPESVKPGIFKRMRSIVHEGALPATIAGTIVLAFAVNLVELACTAGFPAIYTRVLTLNNLSAPMYYAYLSLYIFFYMLDDLLVFSIAVYTLRSRKLDAKEGKIGKLIGGTLMLLLGLILIFKPGILMFGG
ncbi:Uncharacterised protein [uncultured archaeon]|nr:Uncharacterised protein [uncultured archaeon]